MKTISIWLDEKMQNTTSTSETSSSIWQLTNGMPVLSNLQEEKEVDDNVNLFLLSESSLAKDWLKPEEDKAWKDL
ncbi:MAG: hypothetical protein V1871_00790 [Planctomycetota bacterium]